jgi:hypothetical protein
MGAFKKGVRLWANGRIPYVLHIDHPFYNLIKKAIDEINKKTVIIMHERTREESYVEFLCNTNEANWSSVGMIGGRQFINVKHNVRALHEICHCIGMIHEHQRVDRDNHIEIIEGNISEDQRFFFIGQVFNKEESIFCTEYDLNSCMHYWSTCAGKEKDLKTKLLSLDFHNNCKTWKPIQGDKYIKEKYYNTPEILSGYDIVGINEFYAVSFPNIFNSKKYFFLAFSFLSPAIQIF